MVACWAHLHDIPGSRCGPEDGPWPRSFQALDDAGVWKELMFLAKPQSVPLPATRRADCINFQPCPRTRTQDRYVVRQLNVHGQLWTLTGVFDGHLGDATVEHVAHHLPVIIAEHLRKAFDENSHRSINPPFVANLLSRSIVAFDNAIVSDVLNLFPGGIEGLSNLSDAQIRNIINDQFNGGHNYKKAKLCMYGTTAIVALVDPDSEHLWVANVGDCQATLVSPDANGRWKIDRLTTFHNGDNDAEVERVLRAHPGEPECVMDRRVLGVLAPFRCLGDVPFKQPPEFTRRILYNLFPGFHDTSPWEEFLVRNRTPPYITAEPDIAYRRLDSLPTQFTRKNGQTSSRFLILASDGFTDLCTRQGQQRVVSSWADDMASKVSGDADFPRKTSNMALRLLRQVLGGDDCLSVSRVLTLDMDVAWIDDTAIVVQTL